MSGCESGAVVTVQPKSDVRAMLDYCVNGTMYSQEWVEHHREGTTRIAALSMDGVSLEAFAQEAQLRAEQNNRKNEAYSIVQSFEKGAGGNGFDASDERDVQWVNEMGMALAKKVAPYSKTVVITHADAHGGHAHNHIAIMNHDYDTGTALTHGSVLKRNIELETAERGEAVFDDVVIVKGNRRNSVMRHNYLVEQNDAVLEDFGITQKLASPYKSKAQRLAQDFQVMGDRSELTPSQQKLVNQGASVAQAQAAVPFGNNALYWNERRAAEGANSVDDYIIEKAQVAVLDVKERGQVVTADSFKEALGAYDIKVADKEGAWSYVLDKKVTPKQRKPQATRSASNLSKRIQKKSDAEQEKLILKDLTSSGLEEFEAAQRIAREREALAQSMYQEIETEEIAEQTVEKDAVAIEEPSLIQENEKETRGEQLRENVTKKEKIPHESGHRRAGNLRASGRTRIRRVGIDTAGILGSYGAEQSGTASGTDGQEQSSLSSSTAREDQRRAESTGTRAEREGRSGTQGSKDQRRASTLNKRAQLQRDQKARRSQERDDGFSL